MLRKSSLTIAALGIMMQAHGVTIDAAAEAETYLESQLEQRPSSSHSLARALSRMQRPQRDSSWLYRREDRERFERKRAQRRREQEEEEDSGSAQNDEGSSLGSPEPEDDPESDFTIDLHHNLGGALPSRDETMKQ